MGDILSVSKVVQGTLLVDDTNGSILRTNTYALDVVRRFTQCFELSVNRVCSLDGGLSMELGRIGNLEEHVLHDVRTERHLELEWLALMDCRRQNTIIAILGKRRTLNKTS